MRKLAVDVAVNIWRFRLLAGLLTMSQLVSCGWHEAKVPLRGELDGQPVRTTVDSAIARYYVETYLPGRRGDERFDAALDAIHRELGGEIPTSAQLRTWTRTYSADLAALVFTHQVLRHSSEQRLLNLFREELAIVRTAQSAGRLEAVRVDSSPLIVFVPGWLYKTDKKTGADFAQFRTVLTRHGASVSLVETGENLSVEDNARLIEAQLLRAAESGKPVLIVSGSKGGPEVALALSDLRHHPAAQNVKAWLNIGGLLNGTPLADVGLTWPTCWFVYLAVLPDGSFDAIRSLATERSAARREHLKLPPDLFVVNYVAVPLSGDISPRARTGYGRLKAGGPNDGLTYLADAMEVDGSSLVELGVDHYFDRADMDVRTIALARAITRHISDSTPARE